MQKLPNDLFLGGGDHVDLDVADLCTQLPDGRIGIWAAQRRRNSATATFCREFVRVRYRCVDPRNSSPRHVMFQDGMLQEIRKCGPGGSGSPSGSRTANLIVCRPACDDQCSADRVMQIAPDSPMSAADVEPRGGLPFQQSVLRRSGNRHGILTIPRRTQGPRSRPAHSPQRPNE